jgi:hypothetical protein
VQLNYEGSVEGSAPKNANHTARVKTNLAQASGQAGLACHIFDGQQFLVWGLYEGSHLFLKPIPYPKERKVFSQVVST